jgi:hypothetical protein
LAATRQRLIARQASGRCKVPTSLLAAVVQTRADSNMG